MQSALAYARVLFLGSQGCIAWHGPHLGQLPCTHRAILQVSLYSARAGVTNALSTGAGCCCCCCSSPVLYKELSLSRVLRWVKLGLLDGSEVITMKVSQQQQQQVAAVGDASSGCQPCSGSNSSIGRTLRRRAVAEGGGDGFAHCCLHMAQQLRDIDGVVTGPATPQCLLLRM